MPLVCLGLSHHTAPVEVRERHGFPPSRVVEALVALRDYSAVKEAVMLQTCGRLEIYAELDDYETGVAQLRSFLGNFGHGLARERYDLDSYLYTLLGRQAIEHLFRVSTGLDSMLIGEAEILGQVKDAYIQAQHAKSLGKTLHRLFREALNAGKHARSQTRIGDESVSIATAAIDAAKARLGSLEGVSVVVIGAGKMGRTAVRRLRDEGAEHLIVTNRTISRAQELIAEVGFGEAIEMPGLVEALAAADVVVTSTGASHFVVTHDHVERAMARRPDRPLFIIDIAVPRDADPGVREIPGVALVDIDGLKSVVDEKLEVRRESIPQVEEIIDEFITRFGAWYQSRLAVPVIASLTQKAEAIRLTELARLFGRCPELTEREKMLVTGMSMTVVSKFLHSVVVKIREKATSNHAEAIAQARLLDELFELNLATRMAELLPPTLVSDADE
jgi:glutamyl-tRNA reductase